MMMARVRKTLAVFINEKNLRLSHAAATALLPKRLVDRVSCEMLNNAAKLLCVCVLKNYQNIKGRLNFTISPLNIFLAASSSPHPIACVFRLWKTCWKAWHIVHVHDENYNRCWESTKIIFRCLFCCFFFAKKKSENFHKSFSSKTRKMNELLTSSRDPALYDVRWWWWWEAGWNADFPPNERFLMSNELSTNCVMVEIWDFFSPAEYEWDWLSTDKNSIMILTFLFSPFPFASFNPHFALLDCDSLWSHLPWLTIKFNNFSVSKLIFFFWLNGQWNVRIFFLSRINFWCMENFHVAVFFSILHPVSLFAADRWVPTARALLWDAQNWQRQINHLPWWFSYVKNISLIVRDPTQCVMSTMDVDFSMKLNTILFHSSTWSSFLQSDDFES